MHHEQPAGFGCGRQHRVAVPGPDGAQVNQLGLHALRRQGVAGGGTHQRLFAPAHDGDVAARAPHCGLAQRDGHGFVHRAFSAPQGFVLHVHHRVAALQRRTQQGVVVLRRGRAHHHHPRQVRKPGFERLRMLSSRCVPDAVGHTRHQRNAALTTKHETVLGGLVDDFVHATQGKVHHPHFNHGAQTRQRHSHTGTHDGGLADRRVDDALATKHLLQALVLAEDAAPAHVFTNHHHVGVGLHFALHCEHGGCGVTHGGHGGTC